MVNSTLPSIQERIVEVQVNQVAIEEAASGINGLTSYSNNFELYGHHLGSGKFLSC